MPTSEAGFEKILIANRGEIAVRIATACADLGIDTVCVYSAEEAGNWPLCTAQERYCLQGQGTQPYLDIPQLIDIALRSHCDAIHPGYGMLSESAALAEACEQRGITFIGPAAKLLRELGDKASARQLAQRLGLPVLEGSDAFSSLEEAQQIYRGFDPGPMLLKAVAGGGGRGIALVENRLQLDDALAQASGEALRSFGDGTLFFERFLARARHIEVQLLGDGETVVHLWERDCSLQRRRQKLLEIAPAPDLGASLRERLLQAALTLGLAVGLKSLATVEFLVDSPNETFFFLEVNPRVQVEHTITEEVTGIDLLVSQIRIAQGQMLAELGIVQSAIERPRGMSMQLRLNAERYDEQQNTLVTNGVLRRFDIAAGPGVRVDTHVYTGYRNQPLFDSLLAKIIVTVRTQDDFKALLRKGARTLANSRIEGIDNNAGFLQAVLAQLITQETALSTAFISENFEVIQAQLSALEAARPAAPVEPETSIAEGIAASYTEANAILAPMTSVVVSLSVAAGDEVSAGQQLALVEAMKMQYVVPAPRAATILDVIVKEGDMLNEAQALLHVRFHEEDGSGVILVMEEELPLEHIRDDLAYVNERMSRLEDAARVQATAKRHAKNARTGRENLHDLVDAGSFLEYGALAVAAQRSSRDIEDLRDNTAADAVITGIARINARQFDASRASTAIAICDYTVLAGTQGFYHHKKLDRLFELAVERELPVVIYTEGGGGRPSDVDAMAVQMAGLNLNTWVSFSKLAGKTARIAVNNGYCFAGNAALFGSADVRIATRASSIGMAGPVMIEGAGLGDFHPQAVGPVEALGFTGVVDVLADDEAQATLVAQKILGFYQGSIDTWELQDQRKLRHLVPEDRHRAFEVREIIEVLADTDSFVELRAGFGKGVVTGFMRIEGRPVGVAANHCGHLGGALDAQGSDKFCEFIRLCGDWKLPMISLLDTPGFMVGPDSEREGSVRRMSAIFDAAARSATAIVAVCLRKGYGLGAMAMAGGSFARPVYNIAWPTAEMGAMGLEGSIRIFYKAQLAALAPDAAKQLFEEKVEELYQAGRATEAAAMLEFDAVIDPADTRRCICQALAAADRQ